MNILNVTDLTVAIGANRICTDLSFGIEAGQSWAILGENGIGKTTLLYSIAGLRDAVSGEIQVAGNNTDTMTRKELAQRVGLMFQDSHDVFPVTVWETAINGRYPHQSSWIDSKQDMQLTQQVLRDLDLLSMKDRLINTLSGGERRRLAMAMLILQDPVLWLLDEPTNHLDLHKQVSTLDMVHGLIKEGEKAALMVLHDINLARRYCSHALLMLKDEIITGTVGEVITRNTMEQLFQCAVVELNHEGTPIFIPK